MLAPPPRIWPAPPPAHVNGTSTATRYGYSSIAQILPSPQDKGDQQRQQIQQQSTSIYPEEPVKLRKDSKHATNTTEWPHKGRGRIKIEPGLTTPCQVPEVTTSSKHEQQNGGSGIPVGIALARQRVQSSTPPPLTVLTCEERSTNQVTGWSGPPHHWPYSGVDQNLSLQVPPLQLGRDPMSGQLLILPSASLGDSMQRAVLWPSGTTGSNSAPPPLVMPSHQPVLLDRFVTLAPSPQTASNATHHQEKRRSHDHSTTSMHGTNNSGLTVGLFPPPPPPQAPFLMMPFSHQNNSLLLSTQLTEHNLNTMVVTNHQLSESAVLNPMEVITSPVDGFASGSMIQQLPPSVVISHTETNSFVRSDINAVYPSQATIQTHPHREHNQHEQIVIKEEAELTDDAAEEEAVEEETKAEVMDASNQTESPVEESDVEDEIAIKVENNESIPEEQVPPQEPDMSGLELLLNSIAQYEKRSEEHQIPPADVEPIKPLMKEENDDEWDDSENMSSGLGLLCSVAQRCLEEEVVEEDCTVLNQDRSEKNQDVDIEEKQSENSISEPEHISEDSQQSVIKEEKVEKRCEWYATSDKGKEVLKMKLKRRPGRPRKKSQTRKRRSPSRREPPVLQPWSASPDGAKSPLASPPTLTPHKRKLSHDESDEGNSSSGSAHPPPLSPACASPSSSKKRKVGRPKKRGEPAPEKNETIVTKALPCNKAIAGLLMANKHQDHQQSSSGSHKIKPKLKAEAKVKEWCDDEELDLSPGKENELDDPLLSPPIWQSPKSKTLSLSPPRKPKIKEVKKEEFPLIKSPLRTIIKSPKSSQSPAKSSSSCSESPQSQAKPSPVRTKSPQSPSKTSPNQAKSFDCSPKSPSFLGKTTQSQIKPPAATSTPSSQTPVSSPSNITKQTPNTVTAPHCLFKPTQPPVKEVSPNLNKPSQNSLTSSSHTVKSPPSQNKPLPGLIKVGQSQLPSLVKVGQNQLPSLVKVGQNQLPSLAKAGQNELPSLAKAGQNELPCLVKACQNQLPSLVKACQNPLPNLVKVGQNQLPNLVKVSQNQLPSLVKVNQNQLPSLVKEPQSQPKTPPNNQIKTHQNAHQPKSPQTISTPATASTTSLVSTPQRTQSTQVATPTRTPIPQQTSTPQRPVTTHQEVNTTPKSQALRAIPDCKLTEEQLKSLPCRILSFSNGQFYPGEVTKIIAPDIYEVHIYKERCRKPQILCRDEVLSSSVAEVNCPEGMHIPSGTRVCAYWSQQYSCFYPGCVVSDSHSGQIPIDFDDGDNGTIERTRVRFLPQDYPIVEQVPNPLVGKRKRYNSTTSSEGQKNVDITESEYATTSSSIGSEKCEVSNAKADIKKKKYHCEQSRTEESNNSEYDDENDDKKSDDSEDSGSLEGGGIGASDAMISVLEGFFRSEEEERVRLKNGEKLRKRHKHHKHREGSKLHKCKHKHHRSHKHKHSRDESSRKLDHDGGKEDSDATSKTDSLPKGTDNEPTNEMTKNSDSIGSKIKSRVSGSHPEKHEMWSWVGSGVKRGRALGPRGKGLKNFYNAIQRGTEVINLGDCAVFVSTGRPDRPFIGQIESFWQCHMKKNMVVKVSWFYHPEETIGCPDNLIYPGGLFKSPHFDNNDVQTISHKCEVLPLKEFQTKMKKVPRFLDTVYENNVNYFLAGHYNPSETSLTLEPGVLPEEDKK